jgi:hypothetical protein
VLNLKLSRIDMLQTLDHHVRNCLERAADAKRRADETLDAGCKSDFLSLEKSWTCLARSFEFAGRIEQFLLNHRSANKSEWQDAANAPFDRELELAVFSPEGVHALAFLARQVVGLMRRPKNQFIWGRPIGANGARSFHKDGSRYQPLPPNVILNWL